MPVLQLCTKRNESRQADQQTQNNQAKMAGFLPHGDQNIVYGWYFPNLLAA